ncbi:hypothetical protein BLNAU_1915 [Blattamonas nauphoetae]|uniref:Uncharacterized protein n=1 Tax=Blattamonas nauphoetae TaxID=2049346 RepID=A0ABQ9YGL2_9EUKA|nr:hypothetical protein BLNAU_1915 [Blattamonas nauphoetae]
MTLSDNLGIFGVEVDGVCGGHRTWSVAVRRGILCFSLNLGGVGETEVTLMNEDERGAHQLADEKRDRQLAQSVFTFVRATVDEIRGGQREF